MASLYYRKTGTNTYTVYVKYRAPNMPPGKYRYKSTGVRLKSLRKKQGRVVFPKEAYVIKEQIERSLALGNFGIFEKRERLPVSELYTRFMSARGQYRSEKTQYLYELSRNKLYEFIGDVDVKSLNEEAMMKFRLESTKEYKEENTAAFIRHLSTMFNWAVQNNLMDKNPVTKDVRFKPKSKPKRGFSKQDLYRLFEYLWRHNRDLYYLCGILIRTGLRVGDALNLKWEDVDFQNGLLYHSNSKKRGYDVFPLTKGLENFLRSIPRNYDPYILRWRNVDRAGQAYQTVKRNLELHKDLTMHGLKRTYATLLAEAGVPPSAIQKLAHHEDYQTTLRHYTSHEREYLKNQASAIDSTLGSIFTSDNKNDNKTDNNFSKN